MKFSKNCLETVKNPATASNPDLSADIYRSLKSAQSDPEVKGHKETDKPPLRRRVSTNFSMGTYSEDLIQGNFTQKGSEVD